jgi:hypothetical protein
VTYINSLVEDAAMVIVMAIVAVEAAEELAAVPY